MCNWPSTGSVRATRNRSPKDKVCRHQASHKRADHGEIKTLTNMSKKWTPASEGLARAPEGQNLPNCDPQRIPLIPLSLSFPSSSLLPLFPFSPTCLPASCLQGALRSSEGVPGIHMQNQAPNLETNPANPEASHRSRQPEDHGKYTKEQPAQEVAPLSACAIMAMQSSTLPSQTPLSSTVRTLKTNPLRELPPATIKTTRNWLANTSTVQQHVSIQPKPSKAANAKQTTHQVLNINCSVLDAEEGHPCFLKTVGQQYQTHQVRWIYHRQKRGGTRCNICTHPPIRVRTSILLNPSNPNLGGIILPPKRTPIATVSALPSKKSHHS